MGWRFAADDRQQRDFWVVATTAGFRFAAHGQEIEAGFSWHPIASKLKATFTVSLRLSKSPGLLGGRRVQSHGRLTNRCACTEHLTFDICLRESSLSQSRHNRQDDCNCKGQRYDSKRSRFHFLLLKARLIAGQERSSSGSLA